MNKVNEKIKEFQDYFDEIDFVEHNGLWCHEKDGVGYSHIPDCIGTYGQDDRFKSSAYFTATYNEEPVNRLVSRYRITIVVKLFYNAKLNGYTDQDFTLAMKMSEYLKPWKVKNASVNSEKPPHIAATYTITADVYGACGIGVENLSPVC